MAEINTKVYNAAYPVGLYKRHCATPEDWLGAVTSADYDYLAKHKYIVEVQWQSKHDCFLFLRREDEPMEKERSYRLNVLDDGLGVGGPTQTLERAVRLEQMDSSHQRQEDNVPWQDEED